MADTFLSIQNVRKDFGATTVVNDFNLDVERGEFVSFLGPSGCGKTTMLRMVAGFEEPSAGRIMIGGADVTNLKPNKRDIGMVFQAYALFPNLTVAQNIAFGLRVAGVSRAEQDARVKEMLSIIKLPDFGSRYPYQLSGGQQQRVALARALARKPRLMLLDEPFSALDTGLRENMRKAVARVLQTAGITAILVTHDQGEALSFADQVAVLRDGRLIQAGTPQALYLAPRDRETATFLGDAILLQAELGDGFADCALGRIATDAAGRQGRSEIMLRPEQLSLVAAEDAPAGTCNGTVSHVEFGGALCSVSLLLDDANGGASLFVRTSSAGLPMTGSRVRVSVSGKAHVFAATAD